MIPFKEINVLDINSEYLGVPTSQLMENAGKGTADVALERFLVKGKKVAIIGAGPAGLTAGYYLADLGYAPTIFEKTDQMGGMLRFGVPQFRLPNYVLDYDIEMIKKSGVDIKLNKSIVAQYFHNN